MHVWLYSALIEYRCLSIQTELLIREKEKINKNYPPSPGGALIFSLAWFEENNRQELSKIPNILDADFKRVWLFL